MQKRYLQLIAQTNEGTKKKNWELTEAFEHDLRFLTKQLTAYVKEFAKTEESPKEILVTKAMFRSAEFQDWSRNYYAEYYRYDKKDKRNDVDIFVVFAQFLFSVLESEHYTVFDDFRTFETLGDSMFDFCVNESRGKYFTFNEENDYTLTHQIELDDEESILFTLQIVNEDVEQKENNVQSFITQILTVAQECHLQEKVQNALQLINEIGGYEEEERTLTHLHNALHNLELKE